MTYLTPEELSIQKELDMYVEKNAGKLGSGKAKELLFFTKAAQDQMKKAQQKNKQLTIRISELELMAIKAKALTMGVPYQTLIGNKIHELAFS